MIRFNVNGEYLELPADFTLQFQKKNILFSFDNIECERSTSFDIPATPKNDRIFNLAKVIQMPGDGMRRRYAAQMQASGVSKDGYLYVDSYAGGKYKAIFVTGQLFGLLKIKDAGKLAELAQFDDVVSWSYENVPNLPSRATNNWDLVRYGQLGEYLHPSWFLKYVVDTIVSANNMPAITMPANGQGLRVIVGKPQLLKPTDITHVRTIDGSWVDPTQTYPYPRITYDAIQAVGANLSALFNSVNFDVSYRRHWEDFDFQTMQPILRTVTYAGNVGHLVARQKLKITFADDFPSDVYIGTFDQYGQYTGGFDFYGDRSFSKYWNGSQSVTYRTGEPLSGRTVTIEAGQSFTLIRESDLLDYTQYTEDTTTHETWEQGWKNVRSALSLTGITIEGDGDAVTGNAVRLQDNLPDITLVELLKTVAAVTGKVLNYTDLDGITFDDLDADTWSVKELKNVIGVTSMSRKFADYGQRNTLQFNSDPTIASAARVVSAYVVDNDNLEAVKELQTVPFSEGAPAYEGAVEVVEVQANNEKDTIANADTTATRMARASLPINDDLQGLCGESTSVTMQVYMSLLEYELIGSKTALYYNGAKYVWTEAQYSKGVVTLKLSKIPA